MTSFLHPIYVIVCRPKEVDLEGEFEPSLLNSGVYLIQLSMQVSTFAINYQVIEYGHALFFPLGDLKNSHHVKMAQGPAVFLFIIIL